jgi:hypothetical protein
MHTLTPVSSVLCLRSPEAEAGVWQVSKEGFGEDSQAERTVSYEWQV